MRRGLTLVAALAVMGLGCGDDDSGGGATGGTGGAGGTAATGGTGGAGATGGAGGTGGMAEQAVTISFSARVGDETFACGETYELGSADTELDLVDFRFHVSAVELRNADDEWVVVTLDDTDFQTGNVALLDFEDGCGEMGTEELNDAVVGTVPAGTYDAIRFEMGVPFALNHENPAMADPPLNLTAMQWDWQGGYKFLRIDSGSFSGGGWRTHLGSTGCDGDPISGGTTSCTAPNRVPVEFEDFDPATSVVVADAAALTAGQDVGTLNPPPPGCMSGPTDTDCTEIFPNLGLAFGDTPAGEQSFFTAE
ncbi:MAG: MbnP family copper-binding protein [Myxococcota bacterium]